MSDDGWEREAHIEHRRLGYAVRCIPADDEGMEMDPRRAWTRRGARRIARAFIDGPRPRRVVEVLRAQRRGHAPRR